MKIKFKRGISLLLASAVFIVGSGNVQAASLGSKSKEFTYIESGRVYVSSDMSNANGQTRYRYEGTTCWGAYGGVYNRVTGYYYNSAGILCSYDDSNKKSGNITSSGGWLPTGCTPFYSSSYKLKSIAKINDTKVATVALP